MAPLYEINHLEFSYKLGGQPCKILSLREMEIPTKELVTISGPSGSGKSTLLNLLGLIEPVQQGSIRFLGEELSTLSEKRKNTIRKFNIGLIFQQFHLIPVLTAEENVKYFLLRQGLSKYEIENRTQEALEAVGLWDQRFQKPSQLSGGQQQRVAIARAIAKKPDVILADEPTASLDHKTGQEIIKLLKEMVIKGSSIIICTHDSMVLSFSDKNFHIQDGSLV
jgi:putative ABC transport system ATP-binding protein